MEEEEITHMLMLRRESSMRTTGEVNLCFTVAGKGYSTIHANLPKRELQALIQIGCGHTTLLSVRITPWNLTHVSEPYAITAKVFCPTLDREIPGE